MKRIRLNEDLRRGVSIDMSPLIDCVFLLLIFFVVATVFDPDTGIALERPVAATTEDVPRDAVRVTVDVAGRIACDGHTVLLSELPAAVARALAGDDARPALVVADGALPSRELVSLVDACRQGGARRVAVAAREADDAATQGVVNRD